MEEKPKRELIGIVIFDGEKFLLLHRVLHWDGWEFPKGGVKVGETHEEAIKRELFEETGISNYEMISKIDDFEFFNSVKNIDSHATNYLVRAPNTSKITFSNQETTNGGAKLVEHDSYKWYFPKDAIKIIYHDDQRQTLKKAIVVLGIGEGLCLKKENILIPVRFVEKVQVIRNGWVSIGTLSVLG